MIKMGQTSFSASLIVSARLRKKQKSSQASSIGCVSHLEQTNRSSRAILSIFNETIWGTVMTLAATDKYLADLVSDLSESFSVFSNEAEKLSALLARSENPMSPESYDELRKQCMAEVQAFEEYLNRKEEILSYLNVKSRCA
jgi:hypothetical protein